MRQKLVRITFAALLLTSLFAVVIVQAKPGKPAKYVDSNKWEDEWIYYTDWYDYEVSSTFWWRWTEWQYPDGTWKAKYEFKEWSRTTDADGKVKPWNNNVVRIYNQKSDVYVVSEEWGDPWISHQIIKRVETKGVVHVEFDRYTVSKPPE